MADLQAQLQDGLGSGYALERELGRGGMATVFLARDLRHDRPVALKVLHPELSVSLGAERFLREIRLAARLQHPHILTVLDSGEIQGSGAPPRLWFTMPFVRGESLRERLRRERQLPVEDALRIAREAADALAFAHTEGVIHRDIKPENILLTGTHALVADFGIARALGGGGDEKLTETGFAVGTPAYMSPEQAAGQRELDARTDVYSLAVVLYEMLAGETPFAAPTAQAMVARRFLEAARPIRQLRDAVPERVEQALARALARTAADRFASMAQFAAALEPGGMTAATTAAPTDTVKAGTRTKPRVPLAAVTMVLGLLIGLGVLFAWRRGHDGAPAGGRLVAVLPFENVGDSAEEYFAEGITDAVRGKLTGLPGLDVIAGRSSSQYKDTDEDLAQIARELGVTHLVTAKVRWAKAPDGSRRVQVSPELVQVSAGDAPKTRWQQSFDAAMTDVFQVQAEVAGRVAQELGVALADSARRELAERPTRSLDAYDVYLRAGAAALGQGRTDPPSLRVAIPLYERALQLDSSFALAWARLAMARSYLYSNAVPSRELGLAARSAAERALALAPRQPATVLGQASYQRLVQRDLEAANRTLSEFLPLAPRDPQILAALAGIERELGRMEAALEHYSQAARLDPRSPVILNTMGQCLLSLRRYEEADSTFARSLELAPGALITTTNRARARLGLGDLAGARAIAVTAAKMDARAVAVHFSTYYELHWLLDSTLQALAVGVGPDVYDGDLGTWGLVHGHIYAAWGDQARSRAYADSARAGFNAQLDDAPDDAQTHVLLGLSLALLGRSAESVRHGERAAALLPVAGGGDPGLYVAEVLARIYVRAGMPEKAVEQLGVLLRGPGPISREWLRIDPNYAPLRKYPAFVRLVGGTS